MNARKAALDVSCGIPTGRQMRHLCYFLNVLRDLDAFRSASGRLRLRTAGLGNPRDHYATAGRKDGLKGTEEKAMG